MCDAHRNAELAAAKHKIPHATWYLKVCKLVQPILFCLLLAFLAGRVMGANTELAPTNSNVLDIVDYQAKASSLLEQDVEAALVLPKFRAAVAAYAAGFVPIGYAAYFCSDEASAANLRDLTPARLIDLIRNVARRHRLDKSDHRHIVLDHDWAFATFPSLFKRMDHTRLKESHDEFIAEMGRFAASHPWQAVYAPTVTSHENTEYASYWLKSSPQRIAPLISDRRFLAGLDAFRQALLSYGGFAENVFGDRNHVLFPEIGQHLSALVLIQLANAVNRGELSIPPNLREEFPRFYEPYHPEAFGPRPG